MRIAIKKYYEYLFCLLIFFLPLEGELRIVPNIILIILASLYFFIIKKADFKRCKSKTFLIFLSLLLYVIVNVLTTKSLFENLFLIEKLFIIVVIYLLYLPINIDKRVKVSFILGVMLAILISMFHIAVYIAKSAAFSFSEGDIVTDILVTERIYLALMSVLSFVFSLDLIRKATKKTKALLLINLVIVVSFILLVSARMALLSLVFIGIYNLLFLRKYKVLIIGAIAGSLFLSFTFVLNKNLQNRFLYNNRASSFIENFKKWEPRVEIWSCVYNIYDDHSLSEKLFGFRSFNTTNDELVKCYSTSIIDLTKKKWFLKIKYNTHNQFFDFLMSVGFIGFLIFTSFLIISLHANRKDRINFSLILTFVFIFIVENCFHRQIGVYLFAMILILVSKKSESFKDRYNLNEEN